MEIQLKLREIMMRMEMNSVVDFCTHAFGELLRQEKFQFANVKEWTRDEDFWVRI